MSDMQLIPTKNYMPIMGIQDAIDRRDAVVSFTRKVMTPDIDFGTVGGTGKPTLLKPGAEKLCTLFGLTPIFEILEAEQDWTGERHNGEPFFYFFYRCKMYRGDVLIATGDGSCNSMEKKYRYRWVGVEELPTSIDPNTLKKQTTTISEFIFSLNKRETGGKYGKPEAYWKQFDEALTKKTAVMVKKATKEGKQFDAWQIESTVYRVPNPDVADQVNTIQKMAQKRSLIAATLIAVNASEFFTQDLEDFATDPDNYLEGSFVVRNPEHGKSEGKSASDPAPTTTEQGESKGDDAQAEAKIEYKPIAAQDKAAASALVSRHEAIVKQGKSAREKSASADTKRKYAADFRDYMNQINVQLTLRGLHEVKSDQIDEAEKMVAKAVSQIISHDTNAPTIEAQPALV